MPRVKLQGHWIALAAASVATLLAGGCNKAGAPHSARSNAPGLREDAPLASRGGSNPNAPFLVIDHSAHLVKRPVIYDVNTVEPCIAAQLSLFESGAHVDGDRRSVRLNLVNHAAAPCRLSGYPAISLLREDGGLIGNIAIEKITATTLEGALRAAGAPQNASRNTSQQAPSPIVMLAPAGEATFEVGWTSSMKSVEGRGCEQVGSVAVAAPGTIQSFTVRHPLRVCEGRILVTAINDGTQL